MKVIEVSVERLKNMGNYENEKVGMKVEVRDDENPQAAVAWAKTLVNEALGIRNSTTASTEDTDAHFPRKRS